MNDRLGFINGELMRNRVYHNHKENMAWVATALYITGAFILGWDFKDITHCGIKSFAIIISVLITGLAYWFVYWQFNNRRIAASRVKSLIEIAKEYLPDIDAKLACYFKCIEEHKDDPDKTMVISLTIMGIAFIAFILLVSC